MPPWLIVSIIRYVSRVKWDNPGKEVAPSTTPCCSSYRKGSLRVTLDYSPNFTYFTSGGKIQHGHLFQFTEKKHLFQSFLCDLQKLDPVTHDIFFIFWKKQKQKQNHNNKNQNKKHFFI